VSVIRWTYGFTLNQKGTNTELRELLGLELVSLVIKSSRISWFGHVERRNDVGRVRQCMTMKIEN